MRLAAGFVCGTLVLVVSSPAWAQYGNAVPVVGTISTNPAPVPQNSTAIISCTATDPDGKLTKMKMTVGGGLLANGLTGQTITLVPSAKTATQTWVWTAPGPGSYTLQCQAQDNGGLFGGFAIGSKTVSVTVSAAAVGSPPVISTFNASHTQVIVGGTVTFNATASDPDGDPLTATWSASGGTVIPNRLQATFVAPSAAGVYNVELKVTDSTGQNVTAGGLVTVQHGLTQGALSAELQAPQRVAASPTGDLVVVEAGSGRVWLLTKRGDVRGLAAFPGKATAAVFCQGALLVTTSDGRLLKVDPEQGTQLGEVTLSDGPFAWASGIACDGATGRVFVTERDVGRVRAVRTDGRTEFMLTTAGTTPLNVPMDVAVDQANGRLWVLLSGDEYRTALHAFTLAGVFVRSMAPYGPDGLNRGSGLAVAPNGNVYAADAFQSLVRVFDPAGNALGDLGGYGTEPGGLRLPAGLAWLANGDLVVANLDANRLERFGTGVQLPTCAGDTDCDGLSDAWELAYQLNPQDARDALADADGDGLSNLDEFKRGTNPRNADSDGDGYLDGDEVREGYDPLDPYDHKPVLMAGPPVTSEPGLVRLYSTYTGRGVCTFNWRQVGGPTVALRDGATATPSFVGRRADTYRFSGTVTCGNQISDPAELVATIVKVAPRPVALAVTAVHAGKRFTLEGGYSWDGNADPLAFQWDQLLGTPLLGGSTQPAVELKAKNPGLHSFQLTVKDPSGLSTTAELPLLVLSSGQQAPTAMAVNPVFGVAGDTIALDGSNSVGPAKSGLQFNWIQKSGPATTLQGAHTAAPFFVAAVEGKYEFELTVHGGGLSSPADRVSVYVAAARSRLPVASAAPRLAGRVGEPLDLDGRASTPAAGGTLTYRWRQVSGPAAGLTDGAMQVATVVPFEAGAFTFELSVLEGLAESVPVLVQVQADAPGDARPLALATAGSLGTVNKRIELDGSTSHDPDGAVLRYRWTQVAGPWVAIDDHDEAIAEFEPRTPGTYVFELVVDDGRVRSAPARVGVMIFPKGGP